MHQLSSELEERRRSRGATAVEYALIIALIALVVIVALTSLGSKTAGLYEKTTTQMVDEGL